MMHIIEVIQGKKGQGEHKYTMVPPPLKVYCQHCNSAKHQHAATADASATAAYCYLSKLCSLQPKHKHATKVLLFQIMRRRICCIGSIFTSDGVIV